MTQTNETPTPVAGGASAPATPPSTRLEDFEREVAELRAAGGSAARESRMLLLGVIGLVAGIVLVAIGWFGASGTAALNDQISYLISGGLLGLGISMVGGALYLRYSTGRLLRFWLIRLIHEQRAQTDRIVEAIERDRS